MAVTYGTGKKALLDAAIRVVAAEGLRGLTYRSVAAEAGVTHGSVRYHFGDWTRLLEAAVSHSVERNIAGSELIAADGDFGEFARSLATLVETEPDVQAFQYELALESRRRPELRPIIDRMYESYRSAVRETLLCNGIDDEPFVQMVCAALDGLVFQQSVFGDAERTRIGTEALRNLIAAHPRM